MLERLEEEESEARQKLQELHRPPFDDQELEERRAALRTSRSRLDEYERASQHHKGLEQQLLALTGGNRQEGGKNRFSKLGVPLLFGLFGVSLMVAGSLLGQPGLMLGLVVGVLLLGGAAYLLLKSGSAEPGEGRFAQVLRHQVIAAKESRETAANTLKEAVGLFGLDELPSAATLDNVEAQLETAGGALRDWKGLDERLADATAKVKAQEQRVKKAREGRDQTAQSYEASRLEWQGWVQGRKLPESLAPDTMIEFLGRLDTARAKLEQVSQMRKRVAAIEADIAQYADLLHPLALRHGDSLAKDDPSRIALVADTLIEKFDGVRDMVTQRDQAKKQVEEHQQQLEQKKLRLFEAEKALEALLDAGRTKDAEEFRHKARQHAERRELNQQKSAFLSRLQILSGTGDRLEAFRQSLAQSDPQHLDDQAAALLRRTSELEGSRNTMREERGSIETRLNQLTSEEESSAFRVHRNTLMEQLREGAREWSKLTLAEAILERSRLKFERERQPSVIQHAQSFFYTVTGQRYDRLYAPVGQQTITVMDQTGTSKQPAELSRGTREQLYLALRFGLIREFGEHAERLPVVVDEVLVNFDPERASQAAAGLVDLAQTNQVIVFTCHPTTVDLFKNAVANVEIINI